jgi:hypothetical protein
LVTYHCNYQGRQGVHTYQRLQQPPALRVVSSSAKRFSKLYNQAAQRECIRSSTARPGQQI